ncbi:DNA cytosine methyltransferase [Stutzerimonas nitrititolerans]|uniref:DNA cytosine methyltransferase n=1 Tax=Stutzerimonas nitrititolerans TaxID=2482751 RepID=UPI0028A75D2D|nr:DNA cytosine methyltransferase [Stutzerimonas nitrititolerans]
MTRPIGIDLFAGAGGLSLGFEQAGFDVVASVEIDPVHCAVHEFNFPQCKVIARSVVGLSGAEIRAAAKIGDRKIDVVFGGAPCQGFSMIGQRTLDDPRNALVKEFVRVVHELDADFFVFENVKGLTVGKQRKFLDELINEFGRIGYQVRHDWQVLNACHYGVPQDRQRLFLLGAKDGLSLPDYPLPITSKPGKKETALLPPSPTCAEALGDIPDAEGYEALLSSDEVQTGAWGEPSEYGRLMRCQDEQGWYFGYQRNWDPTKLTSSLRTDHSDISRRRFAETEPGSVEPVSRFFKLPLNGVSNTLRAGTDSARGAFTSPRPIHYQYPRCITVREMARLHGFPDWFRFNETKWHGARQIGNAVPPPLGRAVAAQVLAAMGISPVKPIKVLNLGREELLRMGMTEASQYWGIQSPIAKRDRKSGIKKRKQHEVEASRLALIET